jgi:DNA-binding ferritin-like protein
MQTSHTFTTRIDIAEPTRRQLIELLNARLADTFDLYSQLKQAHWNVKGSDFIQLHELYDAIAADVLKHVDTIAERATALGGLALGTARQVAGASTFDEYPLNDVAGPRTISAIAIGLAPTGVRCGRRSTRRSSWQIRTPPISSSRSRGRSTSTCGSSKRTHRARAATQARLSRR